jgi:hypothetical protein
MRKVPKICYYVFEVKNEVTGDIFNVSSAFTLNIKNWCRERNCKIQRFVAKSSDRNYIRGISYEV